MTIGFIFWLFMIFWAVFGLWRGYYVATPGAGPYVWGGDLLVFLLFLLLGIQVFGWPIKATAWLPMLGVG